MLGVSQRPEFEVVVGEHVEEGESLVEERGGEGGPRRVGIRHVVHQRRGAHLGLERAANR